MPGKEQNIGFVKLLSLALRRLFVQEFWVSKRLMQKESPKKLWQPF
jgi:hypothetical protein